MSQFEFTSPTDPRNPFGQYDVHPIPDGGVVAVFTQWAPLGRLWDPNRHSPTSANAHKTIGNLTKTYNFRNMNEVLRSAIGFAHNIRQYQPDYEGRLALKGFSFVIAVNVRERGKGYSSPCAELDASGEAAVALYDTTSVHILPGNLNEGSIAIPSLSRSFAREEHIGSSFTAYLGPLNIVRMLSELHKSEQASQTEIATLEAGVGVLRVSSL